MLQPRHVTSIGSVRSTLHLRKSSKNPEEKVNDFNLLGLCLSIDLVSPRGRLRVTTSNLIATLQVFVLRRQTGPLSPTEAEAEKVLQHGVVAHRFDGATRWK
jgi:hypothetical protein